MDCSLCRWRKDVWWLRGRIAVATTTQYTTLAPTSPRQEARWARSGQSAGHAKPLVALMSIFFFAFSSVFFLTSLQLQALLNKPSSFLMLPRRRWLMGQSSRLPATAGVYHPGIPGAVSRRPAGMKHCPCDTPWWVGTQDDESSIPKLWVKQGRNDEEWMRTLL